LTFGIFYECKFPDSASNAIVPISQIEDAMSKTLDQGDCVLGCDIARFGEDMSVVVVRRGAQVTRIEEWGKEDTMQTTGRIIDIIKSESPKEINVDVVGVGSGVVDRLKELGYSVIGIYVGSPSNDKEKFANLRAEIYWGLRQRFESGEIGLPSSPKLKEQLSNTRYSFNSRGQVQIESKEAMKKRGLKSPDIADSLALAFYTPPSEEFANIDVY
jgi:hypothetical protein